MRPAPLVSRLLAQLSCVLHSEAFCEAHRVKPSDFTRKRCLSLPTVVAFFLQLGGGCSLQNALDQFFMSLRGQAEFDRTVTKSALSQARKKLKASAFSALNQLWVEGWHACFACERWCGLRVVAADGTCVRVARWAENINAYGWGPSGDGTAVMTRCVALFSTATRQLLEVTVGRYDEGERALLLRTLGMLKEDDVLVLDRGYPAWWMFALLQARRIVFCVRIENCGWPVVRQFLAMEQEDWVIEPHSLSAQARKQLLRLGVSEAKEVALRLVKVRLSTGKWEVLATSLLDQKCYPAGEFAALYGQRWGVEESFKVLKHRLHLEGFSGELPHAIEQEIYAKALMHNIAQALCSEATQQLEDKKRTNWQVNCAYAVTNVKKVVVSWFKDSADQLARMAQSLIDTLSRTLELVRPGRKFPRKNTISGAQRPRKAYR